MAKLAILFLACVAFQAAAAFPRYMEKETLMTTWNFENVDSKTMVMHIDLFFKNFCHDLEHKEMDKETILCCIQKFMRFMDVLCEKLECIECTDKIYSECLMVCKNIKMQCEKMLMFTEVHHMKMEFVRCIRMFCMEFNKWCVPEVVCVRLMHKDIFMHLRMMFDECCRMEITDFNMMFHKGFNMHMGFTDVMSGHKDLFMRFNVMCKKLITFCETTDMTNDMLVMYMRKFMMVLDYTIEKMCMEGKCNTVMMREICMELKNIKMMMERCLSYEMFADVYKMKMECSECLKMFFRCMEKMMMCDNCCVGFEIIFRDICMRFMTFCETVFGEMRMDMHTIGDFSMMFHGDYTLHKDLMMNLHMWFKKLIMMCERTHLTKDMMVVCIRKFLTVCDYTLEKLCFGGKCDNVMIHEICTEIRNIKMMLERCLTYDVHMMGTESKECCKMFFRCIEKMMMCDNCCIGFDAIRKDICTYFMDFCKMICKDMNMYMTEDFTTMRHSGMMMGDFNTMHHGEFNMRMFVEKLIKYCETSEMSKETMMMCMRKFMMIVDFCIEKLCMSDKCNDIKMHEICMELKNIKMMLERCLSYGMFTNVYKMKMEFCECIKMFYKCMEMWMTCDNCCVGYEMMWRDICMRFESFYHLIFYRTNTHMTRDFTTMYHGMDTKFMMPHSFNRYMKY